MNQSQSVILEMKKTRLLKESTQLTNEERNNDFEGTIDLRKYGYRKYKEEIEMWAPT